MYKTLGLILFVLLVLLLFLAIVVFGIGP